MRNYITHLVLASSLISPVYALADIKLTIKNDKLNETIWSNGQNLHVKSEKELGYILVKPEKRELYTINLMDQQLIDLSNKVKDKPKIPRNIDLKIEYNHRGPGPTMLGLKTDLFSLEVNGKICQTEYFVSSSEALTALTAGMELMTEYKINTSFDALSKELELCFVADNLNYDRYSKHGFPIKIEDQYGKTLFEVIDIDVNASQPFNNYKFPEGFLVLTYNQMMEAASNMVFDTANEMHPEPINIQELLEE